MKKIAGKLAMILVLIMLASNFTSCFTISALKHDAPYMLVLTIPLDLLTVWNIQLIALAFVPLNDKAWDIFASAETENELYLADAEDTAAEYYSLREKILSLPEEELAYAKQAIISTPETERNASIERLNTLSEETQVSLIRTYVSMPEMEIISSIQRINSLTETERNSLLHKFNSLSESELNSLVEELKPFTEKVALLPKR